MSEQGSLFDLEEGKRRRDEGMAIADAHADDDWKVRARTALDTVISRSYEFTADDVWAEMVSLGDPPRQGRAIGPIIRSAALDGRIFKTGEFRLSERPGLHACPRAVWRVRRSHEHTI